MIMENLATYAQAPISIVLLNLLSIQFLSLIWLNDSIMANLFLSSLKKYLNQQST
jgi:hypothetical protein